MVYVKVCLWFSICRDYKRRKKGVVGILFFLFFVFRFWLKAAASLFVYVTVQLSLGLLFPMAIFFSSWEWFTCKCMKAFCLSRYRTVQCHSMPNF